jgi:aspartyl-tRNA(Asn)/glutamyl-tRNA(Gln) amidotransferase subunit B
MGEYIPTIGLEIHAELKTRTKMFCNSKNDPDETKPNVNICPVCLAHPGTLPVINKEAVQHVLRVGIALGATLANYTEFDRKNYFYPDLPKGYQLSQYEYPLVAGGVLNGVAITRVHLEEDTASSMHDDATGATLVDYNRAGVPLMELVTEPVITSAEQAGAFARELQLLLRYLGASDANMEKGEMRVEANVSISKDKEFGTKVEIKNLNSFRAMERAVAYEIERQEQVLESGGKVAQETRGWDEAKQATFAQRTKEGSADYRYFPDPDLPSLKLSEIQEFVHANLVASLPELPWQRRERYITLGVKSEDAEAYTRSKKLAEFFDEVISGFSGDAARMTLASNYITNDLVKIIRDANARDVEDEPEIPISARDFAVLVGMLAEKKVSSRAAKDILTAIVQGEGNPEDIARSRGLYQVSDAGGLETIVGDVVKANEKVVADFKAGKSAALEYLVGQVMKTSRGSGDPAVIRSILQKVIA